MDLYISSQPQLSNLHSVAAGNKLYFPQNLDSCFKRKHVHGVGLMYVMFLRFLLCVNIVLKQLTGFYETWPM
jgi:hypothetical protein